MTRKSQLLIPLLYLLVACSPGDEAGNTAVDAARAAADAVYLNGSVYTVNPAQPWARAVAIRDGLIVYVGDDDGADRWVGDSTEIVDLAGRMMLPGFHDSHIHLLIGVATDAECDLLRIDSLVEVERKLIACRELEGFGPRRWMLGSGWSEWLWQDSSPDKALLDRLFSDRPVYLESSYGHSAWVNSAALELAGIGRDTPDPPQGLIVRDPETGEATGTLRDSAMMLAADVIPERTMEHRMESVRAAIRLAHAVGITAVIEPGLDPDLLAPVVELADRGELRLRALASLSPIGWYSGSFDDAVFNLLNGREEWRRPDLDVDSVKIYMDGVIESGTGALLEPYADESLGLGPRYYRQDRLNEYFTRFDGMGLQIHVHAIGDAAVRMALDAFEAMRGANGISGNRHHIVHLQLIDPADIPRFAELDISATFQALWAYPDPSVVELDVPMIGRDRSWRMYPIGSVRKSGGRIVGGSDYFVTDLNPLQAIEVALTRQNPHSNNGPVLGEEERVDLATMIQAYTLNGAYLMGLEDRQGSIETGKRADLVVLDRNLFDIPPAQINEARVVLTLFDGKAVYRF